MIVPDLEILSSNSVRLNWNNAEHRCYDIEKRNPNQLDWDKVCQVSGEECSMMFENLSESIDGSQFRLKPSPLNEGKSFEIRQSIKNKSRCILNRNEL